MRTLTAATWAQVKSIFGRALSVSVGRRSSWLEQLSGVSNCTRDEVRKLLDGVAEGDKLEPDHSDLTPEPQPIAARFGPGDCLLGRFEIRRLLGRGGMGEVYEALDREVGPVAVKILGPELALGCASLSTNLRLAATRQRTLAVIARRDYSLLSHTGLVCTRLYSGASEDTKSSACDFRFLGAAP